MWWIIGVVVFVVLDLAIVDMMNKVEERGYQRGLHEGQNNG